MEEGPLPVGIPYLLFQFGRLPIKAWLELLVLLVLLLVLLWMVVVLLLLQLVSFWGPTRLYCSHYTPLWIDANTTYPATVSYPSHVASSSKSKTGF